MNLTRRQRNIRHRKTVLLGVGASVLLHAALFGALTFRTDDLAEKASLQGDDPGAPSFEAIRIVQIEEAPEVDPEVAVTDRPVVNTPAPVEAPEPAASSRGAASAAAAEVAAAMTLEEILGARSVASAELSMRPQFAASRDVGGAFEVVAFADPHAGHDHGEDEEEGEGFWQKLGDAWGKVALGSGGGKVCKPPPLLQPPVVPDGHPVGRASP